MAKGSRNVQELVTGLRFLSLMVHLLSDFKNLQCLKSSARISLWFRSDRIIFLFPFPLRPLFPRAIFPE